MKKKLLVGMAVGLSLVGMAYAPMANAFFIDFESGTEGARVNDIAGVTFQNYGGFAPKYLDGSTGSYNVEDHNGSYDYGSYQIYDNFGMWAGPEADALGVRIDFTNDDGTWFTTGYSANSSFYVDAYLSDASMVTASGANNYGDDMSFLTVTASMGTTIDYVVIHDSGNYWVVDNMSGDASGVNNPVPEPATMLLFGTGLAGLFGARLRRKK